MQFDLEHSIDVLKRTPATLSQLLAGIDEAWARSTEGPDTFSAFDVVGHLIDGDETDWVPRARRILAGAPNHHFEPYDRFRHASRNARRNLDSLLDEFAVLRDANVKELQSWKLTEDQLDLPGQHPDFGTVTLRQLLSTWVVHDLDHIGQIVRVMAKRYRTEIGPWRKYLPIVDERQ